MYMRRTMEARVGTTIRVTRPNHPRCGGLVVLKRAGFAFCRLGRTERTFETTACSFLMEKLAMVLASRERVMLCSPTFIVSAAATRGTTSTAFAVAALTLVTDHPRSVAMICGSSHRPVSHS